MAASGGKVMDLQKVIDDSPAFRKLLLSSGKQCELVKGNIKSILKSSEKFAEALGPVSSALTGLDEVLKAGPGDKQGSLFVSSVINRVLDDILTCGRIYDTMMGSPLEVWRTDELKAIKKKQKVVEAEQTAYEAALQRFLRLALDTPADVLAKHSEDVNSKKKQLELLRFDLWCSQLLVQHQAKFRVAESAVHLFEKYRSFHEEGLRVLDEMQPTMQQVKELCASSRKEYDDARAAQSAARDLLLSESFHEGNAASMQKGYLFLDEKTTVGSKLVRRWAQLKAGRLIVDQGEKKANLDIDMLLCTVQDQAKDMGLRHCFRVVSNERKYLFQAETQEDLNKWVEALRGCISRQLDALTSPAGGKNLSDSAAMDALCSVESNKFCAECGDKNPTWCSINLGVCICLDCSGIHRSLGTHISKVRSATLDTKEFSPSLLDMMVKIGNEAANSFWEARVPPGAKPTPSSTREQRESWIAAKYVTKEYVAPETSDDVITQVARLNTAIKEHDLNTCYKLVNSGINMELAPVGCTPPLLEAVTERDEALIMFFLLNGADVNVVDERGFNALHYAIMADDASDICELMLKRGCTVIETAGGVNIFKMAGDCNATACSKLVAAAKQEAADKEAAAAAAAEARAAREAADALAAQQQLPKTRARSESKVRGGLLGRLGFSKKEKAEEPTRPTPTLYTPSPAPASQEQLRSVSAHVASTQATANATPRVSGQGVLASSPDSSQPAPHAHALPTHDPPPPTDPIPSPPTAAAPPTAAPATTPAPPTAAGAPASAPSTAPATTTAASLAAVPPAPAVATTPAAAAAAAAAAVPPVTASAAAVPPVTASAAAVPPPGAQHSPTPQPHSSPPPPQASSSSSSPPNASPPELVTAQYEYAARGPSDISVSRGEVVEFCSLCVNQAGEPSGWIQVRRGGVVGRVPQSYFAGIPDDAADKAKYPTLSPGPAGPAGPAVPSPTGAGANADDKPTSPTLATQPAQRSTSPSQPPQPTQPPETLLVAMYDYAARQNGELSVKKGDVVKKLSKVVGQGWILIEAKGTAGHAPEAYFSPAP